MARTVTPKPAKENSMIRLSLSLQRIAYPFTKWLSILSILSCISMMFLVTADVFLRRVFNSPIMGSYEIGK
jgi:TRAP-type C4-dicarboxylate transport system permease small subunit